MKQLYIIRHGETDFNRSNIVQGCGVDTALNKTGIMQAEAFYKSYGSFPFDRVYTSALRRSKQSVISFIDAGMPHTQLAELNEISWGDFEGKLQTPEQKMIYWQMVKRWNEGDIHAKIPNGESPYELQQKQKAAVDHILANKHEKNVLICMHGRAMKVLLCLLLNEPLNNMENFAHSNLCLYQLQYDGSRFELTRKNDIAHLHGLSF